MVVDELVAKFGFVVDGIEALKRAMQRVKEFVKGILATVAPSKKAAQALNPLKQSLEKTARAAAPATARMAKFGTAMRVVALGVAGLVTATAVAAVGVAALGAAFAAAGLRAARARRELQLDAIGKGTDAKKLAVLKNMVQAATGSNAETSGGFVDSAVEKLGEKIREARKGDDEAIKALKDAKISSVDPRDRTKAKDSSSALYEALQSFVREQEKIRQLNKDAGGSKSPRVAKSKRAKAEDLRVKAEKQADEFGIGPEMQEVFKEYTAKRLEQETLAAASRAPGPTTAEEERAKALSKSFAELQQKLATIGDAIAKPFSDFAKFMAEKVIDPLNNFADVLIQLGKKFGLIAETNTEYDARTEADRERNRASNLGKPTTLQEAQDAAKRSEDRYNQRILDAYQARLLKRLNDQSLQKVQGQAASKADQTINNTDNREQNADKRTQNVTNNVTVSGLDAITSAIKAGIAPLLAKSANTATSGSGSP
ncbi:hypothetical protein FHT98_0625 [Bosea sp. AK1]|uniref:hypothetical protein n=1 Tax=Bosea sp. AK1 TaxID=2587160 RepID=UPI0011528651|nr:hypothetical protein [Bosea sp. AK1]TQI72905.1 hypothetical protein FHT98_0625 [Bosea sp. AK1]